MRPDLAIVPIRGNVNTRLAKLDAGEVEALVLALCGLERLGKAGPRSAKFWMSASCCRRSRRARSLSNAGRSTTGCARCSRRCTTEPSAACVLAERSMLAALDGSCRTPIAGLATIDGDRLSLDALLLSPDGSAERRGSLAGPVADAAAIGTALGEQLRRDAGPEFGFG